MKTYNYACVHSGIAKQKNQRERSECVGRGGRERQVRSFVVETFDISSLSFDFWVHKVVAAVCAYVEQDHACFCSLRLVLVEYRARELIGKVVV